MDKKKSLYAAFYIFGLLSGILVTYDRTKNKYEKILQDEVNAVKEHYAQRSDTEKKESAQGTETDISGQDTKADQKELQKQLNRYKYNSGIVQQDTEHPYIITPDEFGELGDYETISLTYYSDDVLADDADQIVDDIDETVGNDALIHFGEYEEDSVFVRNDRRKTDYEILRDYRKYADILSAKPYLMEDE